MPDNRVVQFALQCLVSVVACLLFRAVGSILLSLTREGDPNDGRRSSGGFYPLFHGITFSVSLYAVIRSHFVSIHILILAVYAAWLVAGTGKWRQFTLKPLLTSVLTCWKEIVLACLLFVSIFHFLPNGTNTQYDSFFYLKISESLHSTGQENLHTYNNVFDRSFHGVEPYHYIEMWLTALMLPVTRWLLPDMQTFRFVMYTILSVCTMYGLWEAYAVFAGRAAGLWAKVFGIAALFFFPDVVRYLPFLGRYVMYHFDNSYMESINFRTLYLYLLVLLLYLRRGSISYEGVLYFVCLSVISYLCALVLIPSALILVLMGLIRRRNGSTYALLRGGTVLAVGTALIFVLFYTLFSNHIISGVYHLSLMDLLVFVRQHWLFVIFSIFTTLAYIAGIIVLYTGYFLIKRKGDLIAFYRDNRQLIIVAAVISVTGVTMARVLAYQNNAYQLAFPAYILASILIYACWCYMAGRVRGMAFRTPALCVMLAGYVLLKVKEGKDVSADIFRGDGKMYGSRHYTAQYMGQVAGYLKGRENLLGGYLADSGYYKGLYYFGLRNPNVDFLPLSYIIADKVVSNYEFCLSDPADILAGIDPKDEYEASYLGDAIRRTGFDVYSKRTGSPGREALHSFIRDRHLQYLIVSGKGCETKVADIPAREKFEDASTGEIFLVLKTPE